MRLTECSAGHFRFTRKSADWWVRQSGRCLTHVLDLESILVVELRVLNSPDLSDGDAVVAETYCVVAGTDELRLERVDDQVLDVVVGLCRRVQLHFHCFTYTEDETGG